jgi:aspartyl-tRNA(Asn)/glutamyl-tRNA(Gln) amidotransferase subunit A
MPSKELSVSNLGKSISELSSLIHASVLDPRDLVEECFHAIESHNDQSIFTVLTKDRARFEAQAAYKRVINGDTRGPLDGIVTAHKDLFDLKGLPTTSGAKVMRSSDVKSQDAAVITNLKAAGVVTLGRTNMSEFAFSGLGINPHYGTPQNPNDLSVARLPGGSSSGAGVAVASGLLPFALGTDTGGSIRIPSSFNGIVGYKATRGRYDMAGVFPLAESLDSLGPLCRRVDDAILVDAAMRGVSASDVRLTTLVGQRFVIPETTMFDDIEPEVGDAFERAVQRLAKAGARIRRASFPSFKVIFELIASHGALVTAEAFALHQSRLGSDAASDMDPRVVQRIRLGEKMSLPNYLFVQKTRQAMIYEMQNLVGPDEFLVSPTLPHVAPEVEPLLSDDAKFFAMNGKTLRNTQIGNFLDWCGVSIPCGAGAQGLPVGFSIAGLPNRDEQLLSVARVAEPVIRG